AGGGPAAPGLGDRRRGPRPAQAGRSGGRGHPTGPEVDGGRLMAGNSRRRGRRTTPKGKPAAGSGGKRRAGLAGKGRPLPAEERPWHKAYSGTEPDRKCVV